MPRKRKEKIKISFVCEKCRKSQEPDKNKSTEQWAFFDCHERCECGGKFVMKIEE